MEVVNNTWEENIELYLTKHNSYRKTNKNERQRKFKKHAILAMNKGSLFYKETIKISQRRKKKLEQWFGLRDQKNLNQRSIERISVIVEL